MRVLTTGLTGPDVAKVQIALNAKLKIQLGTDGIFGPATAAAVRQFQQRAGIGVDGHVGPATWQKLFGQPAPGPAQPSGGGRAVSPELVAAVAKFEGGQGSDGRFHPYRDSVGVWTIGFGHTAGVSAQSTPLTLSQAEALLQQDLNHSYLPPIISLGVPLNQKQLDALASFDYNLGPGPLTPGHTMGDALRRRDWNGAANAFLLYDKAGGKTLPGLTRRRRWESQLFRGGTYAV